MNVRAKRATRTCLAPLCFLVLTGCSGTHFDPSFMFTEVARIQDEAETLARTPAASAALDRSRALGESARGAEDAGQGAETLALLRTARRAALASIAASGARKRKAETDACVKDLADTRRAWEDALHQLEQTEKVSDRTARGIEREPLSAPETAELPNAFSALPDSARSVSAVREAAGTWSRAAETYAVPYSDLESVWRRQLAAAALPKLAPALAALSVETAAWATAELSSRVQGEAAIRGCAGIRPIIGNYVSRRDNVLWAMVEIERGMKVSARRELTRLADRQKSLYTSLKQFEGRFASIRQEARGTILSLSDILFDFDKATLRREAEINLAKVAVILVQYPEMQIHVEGHSDNIGAEEYNLKLSQRRAEAVFAFLAEQDIDPARMTTTGFGMSQPLVSNETEEGRQKNRRVDLVIREN